MTPYFTLSGQANPPAELRHSEYSDIPVGAIFAFDDPNSGKYVLYWLKTSSDKTYNCRRCGRSMHSPQELLHNGRGTSYYWFFP